jgi:hypothetical protein
MRCGVLTLALSVGLLGATGGVGVAADIPTKAPVAATGPSWVWFGGAAVDKSGWFADIGTVGAFNRNLNLPGWLFRARGGGGHYEYNRTTTLKQGVDYQVGEFMLGYQWFMGQTRVSVYGGANVEHHDNPDPNARVKGTKWGGKVQAEMFSNINPTWYSLLLGNYSTAFDSYFVLGKLGYRINPAVSIGPEAAALGNERFDAARAGGFVAFEITSSASIIVSGGYSWDERRNSLNDNSGGYGTVHARLMF